MNDPLIWLPKQKVLADNGDAIGLQKSSNIWVDHCDLSSDLSHDKDYYDGLLDITHAVDRVTVSYNKFSNHVSYRLESRIYVLFLTLYVIVEGLPRWSL